MRDRSHALSTTLCIVSCTKDVFALNWRVICFPVSFLFIARQCADINIKIEMFTLAAQPKMRFTDLWWERAHVLQCRDAWPTNSFFLQQKEKKNVMKDFLPIVSLFRNDDSILSLFYKKQYSKGLSLDHTGGLTCAWWWSTSMQKVPSTSFASPSRAVKDLYLLPVIQC